MIHSFFSEDWKNFLNKESLTILESLLPGTLHTTRWFGGKSRIIASTSISEAVPLPYGSTGAQLLFIRVEFTEGPSETYLFPLTVGLAQKAREIRKEYPQTVVMNVPAQEKGSGQDSLLLDPLWDQNFSSFLLDIVTSGQHLRGLQGTLVGHTTQASKDLLRDNPTLPPAVTKTEQSNTSIIYGSRVILKLYRRLEEGVHPELEIGQLLTEMNFPHIPKLAGTMEYQPDEGKSITVGLLQQYVENEGDAWHCTLRSLESYFDRVQSKSAEFPLSAGNGIPLLDLSHQTIPSLVRKWIGEYLDSANVLGRCTAELHWALFQHPNNPEFAPEPMSQKYLEDRHQSMTQLTINTLDALEKHLTNLPHDIRNEAREILRQQDRIFQHFEDYLALSHSCMRVRCHGDYHLGQVLWTGRDFIIIDFEGEPTRSLRERRTKHSPLIDVAGMLRSFHYAPYATLYHRFSSTQNLKYELHQRMQWAEFWYRWVTASFLQGYRSLASSTAFWPSAGRDTKILFETHIMEKAVYELAYEMNHRPDWAIIPLQGLRQLLNQPQTLNE